MALTVKIESCLEYWSIGALECWKKRKPLFQFELVFSLLHYSTTPSLQETAAKGKEYGSTLRVKPKPGPLSFYSLVIVIFDFCTY